MLIKLDKIFLYLFELIVDFVYILLLNNPFVLYALFYYLALVHKVMDLLVEKVSLGRKGSVIGDDRGLGMRVEGKIVDRIGIIRRG